jgi:hypothetical protein
MDIKLNLIPPKRKEEIQENHRIKVIIKAEIILTFVLVVFFMTLWSFKYILDMNFRSFQMAQEKDGRKEQHEKIKNYNEKFSRINLQVSEILNIERNQIYWSKIFLKLNGIISPGIEIKSLSTIDYFITLSGIAKDRDELLSFKGKIEDEECFFNTDLPLSDLVSKNNIEFEINFIADEKCLKNQ